MNVCVSFIHAAFWVYEIGEKRRETFNQDYWMDCQKGPFLLPLILLWM